MSDDDVKTMHEDTPEGADDSANQGVGASPEPSDTEHTDDPKSGGTPVHPSPTADSQKDDSEQDD